MHRLVVGHRADQPSTSPQVLTTVVVDMNMHEDRHLSPHTGHVPGLQACTACGRAFVVAVALLDIVDEGLYLLALECKNCDRLCTAVVEDADLERLERATEMAALDIVSALDDVSVARFIDDLHGFTRALQADAVLPDDF
jgi:hypothetical protein